MSAFVPLQIVECDICVCVFADSGLQHPVGPQVPDAEPGPGWWCPAAAGREQSGREKSVCRSALHGREQPQTVHAAQRSHSPRPHVPDAGQAGNQLPPDHHEPGGHRSHHPDRHRLQDQTVGAGACYLAHQP